jgi:RNA polymerase sigma factor (sigma-70 family)
MSFMTNQREMTLLHLVCAGSIGGLRQRLVGQEKRNALLRALASNVGRLLSTRPFLLGRIDDCELSWRPNAKAPVAGDEPALRDEASVTGDVDEPMRPLDVGSAQDWSAVGYDPRYRNIRRLDAQEELRLIVLGRAGDHFARQKLMLHHLPLLKMIARRYAGKGLSLSELVNEGTFGLVRAIGSFDAQRQCRFGTYAKWWIRDAVEQALFKQGRLVRIPGHVMRAIARKRSPDANDDGTVVYDTPSADDGAVPTEMADCFVDESAWDDDRNDVAGVESDTPEAALGCKQRAGILRQALAGLSDRERHVVVRRFGLYTDTPDTLEAVAADLGLSCERVRQIQNKALAKLKSALAPHENALV